MTLLKVSILSLAVVAISSFSALAHDSNGARRDAKDREFRTQQAVQEAVNPPEEGSRHEVATERKVKRTIAAGK